MCCYNLFITLIVALKLTRTIYFTNTVAASLFITPIRSLALAVTSTVP